MCNKKLFLFETTGVKHWNSFEFLVTIPGKALAKCSSPKINFVQSKTNVNKSW